MRQGAASIIEIIDSRTAHGAHVRIAGLFGAILIACERGLQIEIHEVSRRWRRDARRLQW
jgi:hypothetical protein